MRSVYDLIVIGAGPGGQSAAELAAFLGHAVLVVERGRPGGTVTTTGGVPTKTLREIALSLAGRRRSGQATTLAEVLPLASETTLGVCAALQDVVAQQIAARGID